MSSHRSYIPSFTAQRRTGDDRIKNIGSKMVALAEISFAKKCSPGNTILKIVFDLFPRRFALQKVCLLVPLQKFFSTIFVQLHHLHCHHPSREKLHEKKSYFARLACDKRSPLFTLFLFTTPCSNLSRVARKFLEQTEPELSVPASAFILACIYAYVIYNKDH